MSEEFEEGIKEVNPEQFTDELRGVVIDEARSHTPFFLGGAFVILLMLGMVSWGYYFSQNDPEKELQERLNNRTMLSQMLSQASRTLRLPRASTQQIKDAIETVVEVAQTQMREGGTSSAPFISERQMAILEALEGLMRLELEGLIHPENTSEQAFFDELMFQIGLLDLEYHDRGILQSVPLSSVARLKHELRREENSLKAYSEDSPAIREIEYKLGKARQLESGSIAGYAHVLGKWYRYNNSMKLAERAFNIGRRYVEGYERQQTYYPGKRPKTIGPLWKEYVGCIEALADRKIEEGSHREARSLLARIFKTPQGKFMALDGPRFLQHHKQKQERVKALQHDISIYEEAVQHPLALPSYPHYAPADSSIHMERFAAELLKYAESQVDTVPAITWRQLPRSVQVELERQQEDLSSLSAQTCSLIIETLNLLIEDPVFAESVDPLPEGLSPVINELIAEASASSLSKKDLQWVQRSLIDQGFKEAIDQPFILSDGSYLHGGLNPQQNKELIALYEERLGNARLVQSEKEVIRGKVSQLLRGQFEATYSDLQEAIQWALNERQNRLQEFEGSVQDLLAEQADITRQAEGLEADEHVSLDALESLQQAQDKNQRAIARASTGRHIVQEQVHTLQKSLRDLDDPFKEELFELHATLESWSLDDEGSQVSSQSQTSAIDEAIDRQIALKEEYLSLLNEVQKERESEHIARLAERQEELSTLISDLRERSVETDGPQGEELLAQLDALQLEQHNNVQEYAEKMAPLKACITSIMEEEARLWGYAEDLSQARREIFKILGTDEIPGSLSQKLARREQLILAQATTDHPSLIHVDELQKLNREIEDENLRLSLLVQRENYSRQLLTALFPESRIRETLESEDSFLKTLDSYVARQDTLLQQYQALWRKHELERDISRQEEMILAHLQSMIRALEIERLSERQTHELSRHMHSLVRIRRHLEESQRKLAHLNNADASQSLYDESEARGYNLDALDLFQMEHALGLDLQQYRTVFEERKTLAKDLQVALKQQSSLEQKKNSASKQRDQLAIDRLIPLITAKEAHIADLHLSLDEISKKLLLLAGQYEERLEQVREYRSKLQPTVEEFQAELGELQLSLIENDRELQGLSTELLTRENPLKPDPTVLDPKHLRDIDQLVTERELELEQLYAIRRQRHDNNYYKAKAIFMLAESLYSQSLGESYNALTASNQILPEMLEQEARAALFPYYEFLPETLYDSEVIVDVYGNDDHHGAFEGWVNALEQTALALLMEELPKYDYESRRSDAIERSLHPSHVADMKAYIAKSRFRSGEIYMKRGLRSLRNDRIGHDGNRQALSELEAANNRFLYFLDYASPLEALHSEESLLSETVIGAREFPEQSRQPVRLVNQAQINLGIIAQLQGKQHEAIEAYRVVLDAIAREVELAGESLPEVGSPEHNPGILDRPEYQSEQHPLYSSLLAANPSAHEALYRLGRAYQSLSKEEDELALHESEFYSKRGDERQDRASYYRQRAAAYYTQLILTQSYSPFRRAAHLQRALLHKRERRFDQARHDLVAILGSAEDRGGSWERSSMNEKGDLPGELHPGYTHICFELGKLHLESGDFIAAADAFQRAREGDPEDSYVFHAKVGYARTLQASKQWLTAHMLFNELIEDESIVAKAHQHRYFPDLFLDAGDVNRAIGNLEGAIHSYRRVFESAPTQLRKESALDLSDSFGVAVLRDDYRDSIRPLALASLAIGETQLQQRHFDEASDSFAQAQRLLEWLPWAQDRELRKLRREDYELYRDEKRLAAKWGQERVLCEELLYSSFGPVRSQMASLSRTKYQSKLEDLEKLFASSLKQVSDIQDSFSELSQRLADFYETEVARLPETKEAALVESRRRFDRRQGGAMTLRNDALQHLRNALVENQSLAPHLAAKRLGALFSPSSLEDSLLSDFTLAYAHTLDLSSEDRAEMQEGKGNLDNLLSLSRAEERLSDFQSELMAWLEAELQRTGLDKAYLPVSEQARILEEVALYRVAILAHIDSTDAYEELREIAIKHMQVMQEHSERISRPEIIWQMVQIAAGAAEQQEDWLECMAFNRYLLSPGQAIFFDNREQGLKAWTQYALSRSLLKNAEQAQADSLFALSEEERSEKKLQAESLRAEAEELLAQLSQQEAVTSVALATKIMAKEILQRL